MSYDERVKASIFPRSIEKQDLSVAIQEWQYLGNYILLEPRSGTCEMCQQDGLSIHFEIANPFTGQELMTGSECIKRFEVPALGEGGTRLEGDAARLKVNQDRTAAEKEASRRRVVTFLIRLARLEGANSKLNLENFASYFLREGAFTPAQADVVLWRAEVHGLEVRYTDLRVKMRKNREQEQLATMDPRSLRRIWQCLNAKQREAIERYRDFHERQRQARENQRALMEKLSLGKRK